MIHFFVLMVGVGLGLALGVILAQRHAIARGHDFLHRGFAYLHLVSGAEDRAITTDDLEMAFNPQWSAQRDRWLDDHRPGPDS